ncbi:MAG TPA: glycosyltransferase family 39 protein [Terriglobales bacterium]|nr:glycosyltransferase family 39 protein [Terriglobales bacterium]
MSTPSFPEQAHKPSFLRDGMLLVLFIALVKFALHMFFNNRYGYFRDEFDYMACGQHLAWGFVDQPPMVPFLVQITRDVLGDSLRAIRFLPALVSSAMVVLTAMIAREMGGKSYALFLSALAAALAPMYLSNGGLLTTNFMEPLFWMGCAYFAILAVNRNDPRYWLWFGVSAGLGLENKYSIGIFGLGIVVGLLLTNHRRTLWNKWLWIGGAAAFLIFLPNLTWNVQHQWPFLQLMHNIRADGRDVQLSAWQYFSQQMLLIGFVSAPIWITGVVGLFICKSLKPYRLLGWCYVVSFSAFVVLHGKNYYLAPIYPMLLAAGAVVIEHALNRSKQDWIWKPLIAGIVFAAGACFAPITVPILPVESFLVYLDKLPFKIPRSEKSHFGLALPQHYADQFGWEEIAVATAKIYNSLPPEQRAKTAIFGNNYGYAGAIDFFGPRYGLPKAIGGHQSYWLWGPRNYTGESLIVLGDHRATLEPKCASIQEFDGHLNPYAVEQDPIFLCRGLKWNLQEIWPELKKWR